MGVFYQCTNLTTGLMQYNQNLKEINSQMQSETKGLQESVATLHQAFEETVFKINQIQNQVFELEQQLYSQRSKTLIEQKKGQVASYVSEREKTLNDLRNSLQQLI
ncbi:unnamed protein product [Paramecium primaurelia]|uniref:Uncharacterized protein n=2 Tax=Paramecium TaxID=5884 RepID=A0A8S1ULH5_9CILI|nr:unnamed protein product [Paramecium primaurelia]CAD8164953.1 unnamed protein product [Paramecium pentaurelia]